MTDPVATNPELYSVAFENDRVRVLRYHDHPGDQTQPHEHPDSVMITASTFDRMRDKVQHAEAVSQAKAEMAGGDIDVKFDRLERDERIERMLAELKKRRGQS